MAWHGTVADSAAAVYLSWGRPGVHVVKAGKRCTCMPREFFDIRGETFLRRRAVSCYPGKLAIGEKGVGGRQGLCGSRPQLDAFLLCFEGLTL